MSKYLNFIKKVIGGGKKLSSTYGISKYWFYWDYAKCFFKYGCLIDQYTKGHFYKMNKVTRRRAITQRKLEYLIKNYNDPNYIHILKNKNEFNAFFKEFIERTWLYSKSMDKKTFLEFCDSNEDIFIKPLDEQEGHGIKKLKTNCINPTIVYDDLTCKKTIIESVIHQNPLMNLGNKSVNSARILTVIDKKNKAHVLRAGLRAGVGDSIVDNYTAGGVLYEIDIETGIIDHKGIQGDNYDIIYHPGTDICMLGFQMPNWDKAINTVIRAAEKIPQCRFVGWDVAFTQNGAELIEGNHNPGLFTLESLGTPGAYADIMKILNS